MAVKNLIVRSQVGMGSGAPNFIITRGLGAYATSGVTGTLLRTLRRLRARAMSVVTRQGKST